MKPLIFFFSCVIFFVFTSACADITIPTRDPFSINVTTNSDTTPQQSVWIPLYFSKVDSVMAFITAKSAALLSTDGKINEDKRNNQIWIQDDSKHIATIRALIHHLDSPSPQFLIRAKVINVDRAYQQSLGVLFESENTAKKSFSSLNMDEPSDNSSAGELTINIAKLSGGHLLNLQISALEQEGHASVISSPALTTLENQPAVIESGDEVPYQEATSSGATNVSFKKAVLRLQVTPQQMPDHHILLHIALNQDKVSTLSVNGVPAIQTEQISTQVIVADHQTLVLGGILETARSKQQEGIPIVDDIPVIGHLFQKHQKQTKQRELLIFITPSMMKALY